MVPAIVILTHSLAGVQLDGFLPSRPDVRVAPASAHRHGRRRLWYNRWWAWAPPFLAELHAFDQPRGGAWLWQQGRQVPLFFWFV